MSRISRWAPVTLLELSNFTSGLGNAVVMITIPWLILETTGSPAFAGAVAAVSSLPGLVISPLAGWMIDRFDRRLVSIVADLLSALSVIAFPIVALFTDLTAGWIIGLAVLGATFDPAGYTARRTLLTNAARASRVDQDKLNGIHEGIFAVGWTLGPLLGAVLIASVGAINSFWLPGALFLIASIAIMFMRVSTVTGSNDVDAKSQDFGIKSLGLGFVVLWRDKALRAITIGVLVLAAVYLPTEVIILPTYFEGIGDPTSLGIVIAALAGGATIGAFSYGWLSKRLDYYGLLKLILIGTALTILPMAFLPPLPILATAGFLLGLCWGPFNALMTSLIQQRIPENEQGRVFGVQLATFYAAPPLAMLLVGFAVEFIGIQVTYFVLVVVLSITALSILASPSVRKLRADS